MYLPSTHIYTRATNTRGHPAEPPCMYVSSLAEASTHGSNPAVVVYCSGICGGDVQIDVAAVQQYLAEVYVHRG